MLLRTMKKDDLRPYLQVQVFNPDGSPQNLTGKVVSFVMKRNGVIKVNAPATLVTATLGIVEYRWTGTDTDTAGTFQGEFVIDGIDTYPKEGYITIIFERDLD